MFENIIVTFIIAIGGPIAVLWFKYKLNLNKKKSKDSLRSHIFFSEIAYMIDVSARKIDYPKDPVRSAMVRKFIRIKLKSVERNFKNLVDEIIDGKVINGCDFNNTLTKAIVEYERESIEANIPLTFINNFSSWHTPKIKQIRELNEFISRSNIYDDSVEKTSAVLSVILMVLHLTLLDADNTLNNMNGDLDNILGKMKPQDFK